jgi:hypothetical protein
VPYGSPHYRWDYPPVDGQRPEAHPFVGDVASLARAHRELANPLQELQRLLEQVDHVEQGSLVAVGGVAQAEERGEGPQGADAVHDEQEEQRRAAIGGALWGRLPDLSGTARVDDAHLTTGGIMSAEETGHVTGTKDKDYNILWFTEACLSNVLRLETYAQDAEREGDRELADFFRRAQGESRKGAEQAKELLKKRLSS